MAHSVVLHVAAPRKHHARKHHTMRGGFSLGDILGPIGSVVKTALPIVSSLHYKTNIPLLVNSGFGDNFGEVK